MIFEDVRLITTRRQEWYRLLDREKEGTKGLPLPSCRYGDWVMAKRIIVRAGYLWEPNDMPLNLQEELALKWVTARYNMALEDPHHLEMAGMGWYNYYNQLDIDGVSQLPEGSFTEKHFKLLLEILSQDASHVLRQIMFRLRGQWAKKQDFMGHPKELRTFWYVDTGWAVQVRDPVVKMIGTREPGHYWGEDSDPPYFSSWSAHRLLDLGEIYDDPGEGRMYESKPHHMYLHPLDIIPKEN